METGHSPGAQAAEREFVISRAFDAPRAVVFAAWTECERLMRWWGPKGFTMLGCRNDLRPGGVFHYGLRSPGGQAIWGTWTYREVVAPERLVFLASFADAAGDTVRNPWNADWPLRTLSTVSFAEQDGRTMVTVRATPHEATETERKAFGAAHESMRQGWTGTFDQFAAYLASGRSDVVQMQPYVFFDGRCEEALEFYRAALGAEVTALMRFRDSPEKAMVPPGGEDKVMHACLRIGESTMMASDGRCTGQPGFQGFSLSLGAPDLAAAERLFAALGEGGQVQMPLTKTFWSPGFGMLTDRFGVSWMVNVAPGSA